MLIHVLGCKDLSADALPPNNDFKGHAHGAHKFSQLGETGCAALLEAMVEGTDFSNAKAHIAARRRKFGYVFCEATLLQQQVAFWPYRTLPQ